MAEDGTDNTDDVTNDVTTEVLLTEAKDISMGND
jgi:hypothetical protein